MSYSLYCIKECPIGKPISDKALDECESAFDAAFDMQVFVSRCMKEGCRYQKELQDYDSKIS